jgi:hypothetical protein
MQLPFISKKLVLTSPISGGRSIGVVHSRTQAMVFVCFFVSCSIIGDSAVLSVEIKSLEGTCLINFQVRRIRQPKTSLKKEACTDICLLIGSLLIFLFNYPEDE